MELHTGVHAVEPVVNCVDEVREIGSITQLEGVGNRSAEELDSRPYILGLVTVAVKVDSPEEIKELEIYKISLRALLDLVKSFELPKFSIL